MSDEPASSLKNWTPEQIALARRWVDTWKIAGPELEQIRRRELRTMDMAAAVEALCFEADYKVGPRAPKPWSGLVDQQHWFMKANRG
jgi:hypothetical protein